MKLFFLYHLTSLLTQSRYTSVAAIVAFIDLRDKIRYTDETQQKMIEVSSKQSTVTMNEAQLAAMVENAKKSSWQENLHNAADAQHRFMLPGRNIDDGKDTPEYVKNIDKLSEEILSKEKERRNNAKNDQSETRFWR